MLVCVIKPEIKILYLLCVIPVPQPLYLFLFKVKRKCNDLWLGTIFNIYIYTHTHDIIVVENSLIKSFRMPN